MKTIIALFLFAVALVAQPYNGTLTGTLTYTTGKYGNAVTGFTGSDYFTIPTGNLPAGDRSQTFWIKTSVSGTSCALFAHANWLIFMNTAGGITINIAGGSEAYGATNVNDGNWHYVVAQLDGTTPKLYVDGTTFGPSGVAAPTTAPGAQVVGVDAIFSNPSCSGIILDQIAGWGTVTLPHSLTTIPSASLTGSETGLRWLLNLDGNLTDSLGSSSLAAGTLYLNSLSFGCVGICKGSATGGTSPYSNQLEAAPYSGGSCGTYANLQSAQTGATASWVDTTATVAKCYRVKVTDAAAASAYSGEVIWSGASGGGTRSN